MQKINKIVATRCQILRLKCKHRIRFWLKLRPDPAGGAYSAPPDPLAGLEGPTSKGGKGKGDGMRGEAREKGGDEKGRGEGRED